MHIYRIVETAEYEVRAKDPKHAERIYLTTGSVKRDTKMFVQVNDREVFRKDDDQ